MGWWVGGGGGKDLDEAMQLNCQETALTPPLNLRSNLFGMFSAQSRRMFSVGLQGKKEPRTERKRHFKYQMTHLMADIISLSDACSFEAPDSCC